MDKDLKKKLQVKNNGKLFGESLWKCPKCKNIETYKDNYDKDNGMSGDS